MKLYEGAYSQMQDSYDIIERNYRKLRRELSQVDKQINALYHELERTDLCEELGYQYSVALQNILRKRRVIKDEFIPLRILRDTFRDSFEHAHKRLSDNRSKSKKIRESLNVSVSIDQVVNF